MPIPNQPVPSGSLTREEVARRDLGETTVAPATVRLLLALFLTVIAAVPIAEVVRAWTRTLEASPTAWSHLAPLPGKLRVHLDEARLKPDRDGAWTLLVSTNRIVLAGLSGFERALEDESLIGRSLRPGAQAMMTRWLRAGNERVYVGRERWLFYRPEVEYLTGRGFLDPSQLRRRVEGASEWTVPPPPTLVRPSGSSHAICRRAGSRSS